MTDEERKSAGMEVRRQVLGGTYVDASRANRDDFNADFQDYIMTSVWGSIWTRPGIDRRMRSCIVLSILMAHGHWDEFRLHIKAAFMEPDHN